MLKGKVFALALLSVAVVLAAALWLLHGQNGQDGQDPPSGDAAVELLLETSHGDLALTLWPKLAPKHVAQIRRLVEAGIYDGSIVFRLEKGFVAQFGGDYARPAPLTPAQQAVIAKIPAEFNDVKHVRGIVSMARYDDPDSATASFSVLLGNAPHLDGKYTVFGRMHPESEATLARIEAVPVVPGTTRPAEPIVVKKATLR